MIDIHIDGQFPKLNADFTQAMEQIADVMYRSVQENFIAGGRPDQWAPLMPLGQSSHLYQSGRLFESMQLMWTNNSATVFIDTARIPYAAILNFGGTIDHPESNKFQAFWYDGHMVYTWHTKRHNITIPARPFMMFQEEDKTRILDILSSAIFSQSENPNE